MFLIFVEADPVQMRSLLDIWIPAATMPPLWPPLMRLWMMALRARWDYIVPLLYETRSLGDERSARQLLEKARQAVTALDREAQDRHLSPMDTYGDVFDESLQRDLDAVERDYAEVRASLFALEERIGEQLPPVIQRWITNNTKRIRLLAAQFQFLAERLNRPRTESGPSAT
jgi:hypothetical protein